MIPMEDESGETAPTTTTAASSPVAEQPPNLTVNPEKEKELDKIVEFSGNNDGVGMEQQDDGADDSPLKDTAADLVEVLSVVMEGDEEATISSSQAFGEESHMSKEVMDSSSHIPLEEDRTGPVVMDQEAPDQGVVASEGTRGQDFVISGDEIPMDDNKRDKGDSFSSELIEGKEDENSQATFAVEEAPTGMMGKGEETNSSSEEHTDHDDGAKEMNSPWNQGFSEGDTKTSELISSSIDENLEALPPSGDTDVEDGMVTEEFEPQITPSYQEFSASSTTLTGKVSPTSSITNEDSREGSKTHSWYTRFAVTPPPTLKKSHSKSDESLRDFYDEVMADLEEGEDKDHTPWYKKFVRNKTALGLFMGLLVLLAILFAAFLDSEGTSGQQSFFSATSIYGKRPTVNAQMLVARMSAYPGYMGPLKPHGMVMLRFDDENRFLMSNHVTGLEPLCNDCMIHIHEGTTCFNTTNEPYWNHAAHPANPWGRVHYQAANGRSDSAVTVETGFSPDELESRTIVMHAQDGQQLACGILAKDGNNNDKVRMLFTEVEDLPPYEGTDVHGEIRVEFFWDDSMLVDFALSGLPPQCDHCKIAIQEGFTCDAAAGSHYWDKLNLFLDPWAASNVGAFYNSDEDGNAHRSFFIYTGFGYHEHIGHAITVRGPDGSRIGCGILGAKPIHPPTTSSTSL